MSSNAGGGGERVLWAAIRANQQRHPKSLCVVYTGDHEVDKTQMLNNVKERFDIDIKPSRIVFLYLTTRHYANATFWPRFTLLGQSIGSLYVAWDAFSLLVPDVFVDTAGYAFSVAMAKVLFPTMVTAAYVHYPTISTDMLDSLNADPTSGQGLNAGTGKGWRGAAKRQYWKLFARLYSWAGGRIDFVMTNSSWTQDHITKLWTASRRRHGTTSPIAVLFPPTAVAQVESQVEVSAESEHARRPDIVYISQFRPEKNHQAAITAFAEFVRRHPSPPSSPPESSEHLPRLILIGSVRNDDDSMLVYKLRVQAKELSVSDRVVFVVNSPWSTVLDWLRTSSLGVNGMWNEHFGIGVVEYQAAGLIAVVNDSGGPKLDIVVPDEHGRRTGYHASHTAGYADAFEAALALPPAEKLAMRLRARKNATRFSEEEFERKWNVQMQAMIDACAVQTTG